MLAPQAAGAATVVCHRDDCGDICDKFVIGSYGTTARHMVLQAAQQCGKARATAQGDDTDSSRTIFRIASFSFQSRTCRRLSGSAVFLRVEKLRKTGILLEEGKVIVIARVKTIFRAELDRQFQILHRGFRFAGKAIERGHRINDVVHFGSKLTGFPERFARFVPPAEVHHGHAALIIVIGCTRVQLGRGFQSCLDDAQMHARSIGKLFAGTGENLFQFLPSAHQLLLLEEDDCLFVGLELSLNVRVAKLDAAALRGRSFC